jgi:hypothetical protein
MRSDHRWLLITGGSLFLFYLSIQLNHYLAAVPVSLFLFGLPIAFAALRLNLSQGLTATVLTGLCYDALTPFPPGSGLLLFSTTFTVIYAARSQFHREEAFSSIIVVLLANLFLIAAFTTIAIVTTGSAGHPANLVVNLIASQLAVAALTRWFFAFQMALLELFGINLEEEQREAR